MMKTCKICGKALSQRQKVYCSIECQTKGRCHSIEDCHREAHRRNGECLSTTYVNNRTYMRWKCKNGHEWSIPFANILAGNWCKQCVRQQWDTSKMQEYIQRIGGKCSDEYKNMKERITVICPCGHSIDTNLNNVVQGYEKSSRFPCIKCRPKWVGQAVTKYTSDFVEQFVESKGGRMVGQFTRVDEPMSVQCNKNHVWTTTLDRIKQGHWCPHCAHNRPLTLDDVRELGKQRGFVLLSRIYIRASDYLKWKCKDGHVFEACWNSISNGSGCPYCYGGINEEKCRFILEQSFLKNFPTTRKALGNHYQLDGYCPELSIAFEYQGEQHYEQAWYHTKKSFQKLKDIDTQKKRLCERQNITLLEIPYWKANSDENLLHFIETECERLNLSFVTPPTQIDISKFKGRPSRLKKIREIIERDGGILLSGRYVKCKEKTLEVQCKYGHIQTTSPQNILRSQGDNSRGWCFQCGNNKVSIKRKQYWQRQGRFDYDKMKEMYANGKLMKEISEELGCGMATVSRGVHYKE